MKKAFCAFLAWLDETWAWHWFARKVLGHLTLRLYGYPKFDFEKWHELCVVLQEAAADRGAVYAFVLADRLTLASILIRKVSASRWSHAGWLRNEHTVVHMKGKGVCVQHILCVLHECDDFALVRFQTPYKQMITARIDEYASAPNGTVAYDFEQELESDSSPVEAKDIYCSELVWVCGRPELALLPSVVLGRNCFSPDDVASHGQIVWSHVSCK